jgi:uncharacterized repeat protein (TIGR01451 family)
LFLSSGIDITANTSLGNIVSGSLYIGGAVSAVTATDNILKNGVDAIVVEDLYAVGPNSTVTANNNCIAGNSISGLRVATLSYSGGLGSLNAQNNWWGAASGPSGVGPGSGDAIVDPDGVVDFTPFLASSNCGETADVNVTKTDAPDPGHVGQKLTYTITVHNDGPDSASGVTLVDTLPKTAGFGSAISTQGTCVRTKTGVTCNIGTMANGATVTVTIVVKPTKKGTITNTVTVASTSPTDPNLSNNTASTTTTVKP